LTIAGEGSKPRAGVQNGHGTWSQRGLAGVFSYLNHCRFAPLASEIQLKLNMGLNFGNLDLNFRRENPN
jgi:hypothetical protein